MSKNDFSTTINQRFEKLIDEFFGGNKSEFSRAIGVGPSVIGNMLGGRKGNPSFEVVQRVIDTIVSISPDWLLTGKGNMLREASNGNASTPPTAGKSAQKQPHQVPPPVTSEREALLQEQVAQKDVEIRDLNREIGAIRYELAMCRENVAELEKKLSEQLAHPNPPEIAVQDRQLPTQPYPALLGQREKDRRSGAGGVHAGR
jgi:hypothetical protein